MLKTFATLLRGAAAAEEEALIDRNALLILDQQVRDVIAGVEAGKRALAIAMAHRDAEARRLVKAQAILADLESRAVAALQGGREDLAHEAAAAILAVEADLEAARGTHAGFETEVVAMHRKHGDATRRLAALQRGRSVAQAAEAVRRLRAGSGYGGLAAASCLADAEATLARLRVRQAGESAVEAALEAIGDASAGVTASAVAARLGAEGFGTRTAPALSQVMARLAAKAGTAAMAQPT